MFVIPVPFAKYHKEMLAHFKKLLEYQNGQVGIHPKFTKLFTALRIAEESEEGMFNKDATSFDDLFNRFRLSLKFFR
jgi:hypothetical protein